MKPIVALCATLAGIKVFFGMEIDNADSSESDRVASGRPSGSSIVCSMISKSAASGLLEQLQHSLVRRDIRNGFSVLNEVFSHGSRLDIPAAYFASFLLAVAQWVDLGYRDIAFLDGLMVEIAQLNKAQMPTLDFLKISMVEAYRALADEHPETCVDILDLVLRVGVEFAGDYLLFLANFWKGRALRKRGDYDQSCMSLAGARAAADRAKAPKLVAVTKIHQSWLTFQKGDRASAMQLLDEAETALRSTGHALSLGNIESARGRFVRRSGEYKLALKHFEAAIVIYRKGCPEHPNLARALVNAAYVKRLIALDMRPRGGGERASGATHALSLRISGEALQLLAEAGAIYVHHHHQGGTGSVLVNGAHLHLDNGDIDQASIEGEKGFVLGKEKDDLILMARSRIVQSAVELARAEEQLGDQPDIALHSNLAVDHAHEAMDMALHTQNKRLLAEAYLARAMAAASEYFQDWEVAKDYTAKAGSLLGQNDRDHLYKVLASLKVKLSGATRIEDSLRQWSEGQLGNKSFLQVQEEFAELVIPKVWLQMGKNVTRVAKKLSISPKKVRRILRNTKNES